MGKEIKGKSPILLGAVGQAMRPLPEGAKKAFEKAKKISEFAKGKAMRPLPEGAKKAFEKAEEAKKISEFAKGKAIRPISKKKKPYGG